MVAILEEEGAVRERQAWPSALMVPLLMMQGILLIPAWHEIKAKRTEAEGPHSPKQPLLSDPDGAFDGSSVDSAGSNAPTVSGSSLIDMAKDANFWLLSCVTMFGTGAGLTVINNIAQQVKAVRDREGGGDASLYIVLISVANCGGRLFWGYVFVNLIIQTVSQTPQHKSMHHSGPGPHTAALV